MQVSAYQSTEVTGHFDKKYNEQSLRQFAPKQKSRKKWLIVQPVSNTNMMVDSGSVSMPSNLSMVTTLVAHLFDVTFEEMKPRLRHFDWDKYDTYRYMFEPENMSGEKPLKNFVKLQKEGYRGKAIPQRMQGKPLNWVWLANYKMNRFTSRLKPDLYL